MTKAEIIEKVKKDLGFVPDFLRDVPEYVVEPLWDIREAIRADTEVPWKYKGLIILSVASYLRDPYLLKGFREYAKWFGASDQEINEAVAIAGQTALLSTWSNGYGFDSQTFEKEVNQFVKAVIWQIPPEGEMSTTEDVYHDIEATFGEVPSFLKDLPEAVLKGVWRLIRRLELGETAIPAKYKALISLAVTSVIPSPNCASFLRESLRALGATETEIKTAVLLASLANHNGTMLNGMQYDMEEFARERAHILDALMKVPVA